MTTVEPLSAAPSPWDESPAAPWATQLDRIRDFAARRVTTAAAMPLHAGLVTALVGAAETGKSWLALHAVLDAVRDQAAALVLDGEMSAASVRSRLLALGAGPEQLRRVWYAGVDAVTRGDAVLVDRIAELCDETGCALVLVDSAGSLLARTVHSENDNAQVTRVFDRLRQLVSGSDRALLVVDHVARSSPTATPRGATAKFAALDVQLGVTLPSGVVPGTEQDWTVVISIEKDRHAVLEGRNDFAALFTPLGGGALNVDISRGNAGTHRLAAGPDRALEQMRALTPPATSANDAARRLGGNRTAVLLAYKAWRAEQ